MAKNKYKKRSDGNYETKIQTGYDDKGKRIRLSITASSSIELENKVFELKQKLKLLIENYPTFNGLDYKNALINGDIIKHSEMTLEEYADEWFITNKSNKEINTKAMYENIITKHINPNIGHLEINTLKHSDIQKLITNSYDKPRTCQQILMVLKQIFKDLKRDRLISLDMYDNLVDKYDLPKYTPTKKRPLTKLEKKALVKADFTESEKAFVMILFYFGVRREEAIALIKSDFDWKNKLLNINRAIVFDKNTPVLKSTKSFAGNRSINIPDDIYTFLKSYVSSCNTIYLFTKQNGELITKSSYDKMWKRIILKMNLSLMTEEQIKYHLYPITGLTAHIFRHNYCTMLYYSGISELKAIELMGHADKKMIMEVYAHLDEEQENTVDKINNTIKLEKAL